ncbi:hypothetical protein D3C72_1312940 [compost metagenome]
MLADQLFIILSITFFDIFTISNLNRMFSEFIKEYWPLGTTLATGIWAIYSHNKVKAAEKRNNKSLLYSNLYDVLSSYQKSIYSLILKQDVKDFKEIYRLSDELDLKILDFDNKFEMVKKSNNQLIDDSDKFEKIEDLNDREAKISKITEEFQLKIEKFKSFNETESTALKNELEVIRNKQQELYSERLKSIVQFSEDTKLFILELVRINNLRIASSNDIIKQVDVIKNNAITFNLLISKEILEKDIAKIVLLDFMKSEEFSILLKSIAIAFSIMKKELK